MRRALVVSTVHPPDDPRIRHKLIPSLSAGWQIRYACRTPGPTSKEGIEYRALRGGRLRRDLAAARLLMGRSYDVASVHDPELLPAMIAASLLHRRVVFDLHENLPAQLRARPGWPQWLREIAATAAGWLLRLAARVAPITLAESGYASLIGREAPVFPNYPAGAIVKPRPAAKDGGVVYLGDVTRARGIDVAVRAVAKSGTELPFDVIGRVSEAFAGELTALAAARGVEMRLHGYLPLERALAVVAGSVVGLAPLLDLPNYRESMPTKVLEYLAAGVPVVASDLPGTAAVIGGLEAAVLVPPGNADALAVAIRRVARDPGARSAAAAGADAIVADHTWPAAEVAGFYAALA